MEKEMPKMWFYAKNYLKNKNKIRKIQYHTLLINGFTSEGARKFRDYRPKNCALVIIYKSNHFQYLKGGLD